MVSNNLSLNPTTANQLQSIEPHRNKEEKKIIETKDTENTTAVKRKAKTVEMTRNTTAQSPERKQQHHQQQQQKNMSQLEQQQLEPIVAATPQDENENTRPLQYEPPVQTNQPQTTTTTITTVETNDGQFDKKKD